MVRDRDPHDLGLLGGERAVVDASFCLSAPGISSVQLGFGLLDPEALDQGTLAAAEACGLGIIAHGFFGGGLLKDGLDGAELEVATPNWQQILALRSLSKSTVRSVLDLFSAAVLPSSA